MRRFFSILLLAVFGLPLVSPLFALGKNAEAGLPACCRKDGKHHCMMSMSERAKLPQDDPQWSAPTERCPYYPQATIASHKDLFTPSASDAVFASLVNHPSGVAQTESKRRISRDRSRQKRGPPTILG